jgi:hypothetical protein
VRLPGAALSLLLALVVCWPLGPRAEVAVPTLATFWRRTRNDSRVGGSSPASSCPGLGRELAGDSATTGGTQDGGLAYD